ncbi:MAG: hypothetical protein IGR92_18345 [Leptolyngbyaceae cyanobacterium T60_A2020_046]|nr:hypothetical protein [Leptolyngbyaceae cyanobacterium T60_A2020_046]
MEKVAIALLLTHERFRTTLGQYMIPILREGDDEHPLRGVSQRRQFPKLPSIAPRMDTGSAIAVLIFSTPEPC